MPKNLFTHEHIQLQVNVKALARGREDGGSKESETRSLKGPLSTIKMWILRGPNSTWVVLKFWVPTSYWDWKTMRAAWSKQVLAQHMTRRQKNIYFLKQSTCRHSKLTYRNMALQVNGERTSTWNTCCRENWLTLCNKIPDRCHVRQWTTGRVKISLWRQHYRVHGKIR